MPKTLLPRDGQVNGSSNVAYIVFGSISALVAILGLWKGWYIWRKENLDVCDSVNNKSFITGELISVLVDVDTIKRSRER